MMQKLEGNLYHSKNKNDVNCFDQISGLYSTKSTPQKWPLAAWENMLDIPAINT